jgi:porphobilinogen synthase
MTRTPTATSLTMTRRLRRLRRTPAMRALVRETRLAPDMFMLPLFVCEGEGVRREVASMPGVFNLSVDEAVKDVAAARSDGIHSVILFGIPDRKDDIGSLAYDPEAPVQSAIRAIKREVPDVLVATDVCLCEYTDHGHCGIVIDQEIANDPTVDQLVRAALSHAAAGADIVAPSDMMDGRIGAIRQALDERGFTRVSILSYAAKYASAFYAPFREAVGSSGNLGNADKRTYQMDPGNSDEALREVALDIAEGADMVMVKPGLPYLDIIRRVKDTFGVPTFAYQVSGEYAMVRAAAEKGWLDGDKAMMESLLSLRRAGADAILTYAALDVARRLKHG